MQNIVVMEFSHVADGIVGRFVLCSYVTIRSTWFASKQRGRAFAEDWLTNDVLPPEGRADLHRMVEKSRLVELDSEVRPQVKADLVFWHAARLRAKRAGRETDFIRAYPQPGSILPSMM